MDSAAIEFGDRTLYLADADVVVCADLHLGRSKTAAVEFPLGERDEVTDRIETALKRHEPATLVLAGDILHAFETVPRGVEDALGGLVDLADRHDTELVLIEGNHDRQLSALAPVPPQDRWRRGDHVVVHHGDTAPSVEAALEVVGHVHPMIVIEGQRRPCFLYDPAATPPVVVLPPVNPLLPGVPVNTAQTAELPGSVLEAINRTRPVVYDPDSDETLWFPPLAELRTLL